MLSHFNQLLRVSTKHEHSSTAVYLWWFSFSCEHKATHQILLRVTQDTRATDANPWSKQWIESCVIQNVKSTRRCRTPYMTGFNKLHKPGQLSRQIGSQRPWVLPASYWTGYQESDSVRCVKITTNPKMYK